MGPPKCPNIDLGTILEGLGMLMAIQMHSKNDVIFLAFFDFLGKTLDYIFQNIISPQKNVRIFIMKIHP